MSPSSAMNRSDAAVVSLLPLTMVLLALESEGAVVLLVVLVGLLGAVVWYVDFWFRLYLDGKPREADRRAPTSD